ncbi:hypothetical protein [Microcoleus sp. bin38.metabat.b11b12b14.051]|uniref:hypothetical protein n=1 Tax=Microcoleus sp. bin38.metabat.b11b12b14.051 TaxID=2742709 RepID=UPI0025CD6A76|nr:hypothetical protein [Microcoleus sp. bin38.metabat.b11b12b14.051]
MPCPVFHPEEETAVPFPYRYCFQMPCSVFHPKEETAVPFPYRYCFQMPCSVFHPEEETAVPFSYRYCFKITYAAIKSKTLLVRSDTRDFINIPVWQLENWLI